MSPQLLRIKEQNYILLVLRTDWGRGFRLVKTSPPFDVYDIMIDGLNSWCDCQGCLAHGHCKHLDHVRTLFGGKS